MKQKLIVNNQNLTVKLQGGTRLSLDLDYLFCPAVAYKGIVCTILTKEWSSNCSNGTFKSPQINLHIWCFIIFMRSLKRFSQRYNVEATQCQVAELLLVPHVLHATFKQVTNLLSVSSALPNSQSDRYHCSLCHRSDQTATQMVSSLSLCITMFSPE